MIGSVVGAHPYPYMVREFQKVIGVEARAQCLERYGRLPSDVVACVGGGSNAIGIFAGFVDDPDVKLWGVEAAGDGIETRRDGCVARRRKRRRVARLALVSLAERARDKCATRTRSARASTIRASVPSTRFLKESGRATYVERHRRAGARRVRAFARSEGIIPALESAHAIAFARKLARERGADDLILVNLSGRGDKDLAQVERARSPAALEAIFDRARTAGPRGVYPVRDGRRSGYRNDRSDA